VSLLHSQKLSHRTNWYIEPYVGTVEDFGKGYDESLDSKEDGGFGLSIARKLVDVFKIER